MLPVGVQRFVAGSYSSRGSFSVPPGIHVPVAGSYSSAVDSPVPPTTRTRPLSSGVAVKLLRGTAMSAVAIQLPAAVLADEASGAATIASSAQIADAAAFVVRLGPPFASLNKARVGRTRYACLTRPLN